MPSAPETTDDQNPASWCSYSLADGVQHPLDLRLANTVGSDALSVVVGGADSAVLRLRIDTPDGLLHRRALASSRPPVRGHQRDLVISSRWGADVESLLMEVPKAMEPTETARRLRHSSPVITLGYYAHFMPEGRKSPGS
ncbi:hypothetical protein [Streptomyces niveus]|uniref:hypothetical protein n=1 Tax=Streptomyces niveus TaxID=193462 RepID=UPI00365C1ED2